MSASIQSGTRVANLNDAHELFKIHARHDTDTQSHRRVLTLTPTLEAAHKHTHARTYTHTHIRFTAPSSAQSWREVFIFAA